MTVNPYAAPAADLHSHAAVHNTGELSDAVIEVLTQTKPWVRVVGVFLWIGVAFMVLAGFGMLAGSMFGAAAMQKANPALGAGWMIGMAIVYVVMAGLYIYPALQIWRYGSAIERLETTRTMVDLHAALDAQRSFWKMVGIAFLSLVVVYAVVIVGALVIGVMSAASATT